MRSKSPAGAPGRSERELSSEERARLTLLALPTLALAFAITTVSTYLGTVVRRYTHDALLSLTHNGPFKGTSGFQAMWIVCAAAALLSIVFVRRLRAASEDRRELRGA
jgi:hypothetical protein